MKSFSHKLLLLCLCLLARISACAYNAKIDGIYYNFSGNQATVTYQSKQLNNTYHSDYSGDIVIPESVTYNGTTYSVTSIGNNAFRGCSGLNSVTIPNSVTSIGNGAFAGCSGLASITVKNGNTYYDSRNNCNAIIETTTNTLIVGCKKTIIPNSVTSIGNNAFRGCSGLNSVTIPNSVTSIGDYAFSECVNLTDVRCYAESVSSTGINAFYNSSCSTATLHVPTGSVEAYSATEPWSNFGNIEGYFISFADSNVKALCVANWDTNGDGELDINEAADVTDLGIVFKDNKQISSFDELSYFTGLASIASDAFSQCSALSSISIPNGVASIGDYAFQGCSSMKAVHITDLTAWCNISFRNSTSQPLSYAHHLYLNDQEITDLVVPEGVTSIADYVFKGCTGLMTATLSKNVVSIGNNAFNDCGGLTMVYIPNRLTSVGSLAFYKCTALKDVYCYAEDVPSTNSNAFKSSNIGAATLHVLDIAEEAYRSTAPWSSFGTIVPISSFIIFADANVKAICVANWDTNGDGELTEEEAATVTDLGEVFYGNTTITSFNELQYFIGLTSIGSGGVAMPSSPFYGCSGLTSITIPESVTSIGKKAFYNCSGLTSFTIPNSVTNIGPSAFSGCSGLTSVTIPNSVTSISNYVFQGCTSLKSVYIPEGVTSIGNGAFKDCSSLTSVTLKSNAIVSANRSTSSSMKSIFGDQVQKYVIGEDVTAIGDYAFKDCNSLSSLTIGNSVTTIGMYAFSGCSDLTSVTIPHSVTTIGESAFNNCSGITAIIIPENVSSIGNSVFSGCSCLTSVTIPEGVTTIGESVFSGCSCLTSVTIPKSVTRIGIYAFKNCSGLKEVFCYAEEVPDTGSNVFYGTNISSAVLYVPTSSLVAYKTTSPWRDFWKIVSIGTNIGDLISFADANVKSICVNHWDTNGDDELSKEEAATVTDLGTVFKGNTTITSFNELQYFTGLTSIGNSAFSGCRGLTSVNIPESLTSIGDNAFSYCSSMTSITIPKNVTSIGRKAFSGCRGLTSIIVDTENVIYDSRNNCNAIINTATNKLITGCKDSTIPNSVTCIDNYAFEDCSGLTSLIIPNSVTSIGSSAFSYCRGLNSITLSNNLVHLEDSTFYECSRITSIIIPNRVTTIGNCAFSDCSSLTSVNIPNSVTNIGNYAFYGCGSLTSVNIPNGVTSIAEGAFANCNYLTSITIPNSVTSIGNVAFLFCGNLTSITIPESVTSIGNSAFSGCSSLTSITIPKSVTSIGNSAFYGCSWLQEVFCNAEDLPSIGNDAFDNSNMGSATLYVPENSIEVYRTTLPWKNFGRIVAILGNASDIIVFADAKVKAICVANWDSNGDGKLSKQEAARVTKFYSTSSGLIVNFFEGSNISSFNELKYFTGLTRIDDDTFRGCTSLTSATLPQSVTDIGENAFYGCRALTSINLPPGVTIIGYNAFSGCSRLTSITIPSSLTRIEANAFGECNSLQKVIVPDIAAWCGIVFGSNPLSYAHHLFSDENTEITNLVIPGNVSHIHDYAFSGCNGLKSVTIPNSVTSIGQKAFSGCDNLYSVSINTNSIDSDTYDYDENHKYGLADIFGTQVREYILGNSVTSIGYHAFSGCSSLKSITIPNTVTSIGGNVFAYCDNLASINIEIGNANYDSRNDCNAIIETATNTLIAGCKNTFIPNSVTSIGEDAFYYCSALTFITIPDNVKFIGDFAFYYCSGLTSVNIPNGVTKIGDYTFKGCTSLTSITIPNSVKRIEDNVFQGCI